MKKVSKNLIAGLMLACCLTAAGAEQRFTSPDGTMVVVVDDEGGRPGYTVSLNGKTFLTRSPLGVTTNMDDLTRGSRARQLCTADHQAESSEL